MLAKADGHLNFTSPPSKHSKKVTKTIEEKKIKTMHELTNRDTMNDYFTNFMDAYSKTQTKL